ncbi:hypothetical protein [Marinobacterium mangrovicola]|uniref:Tetratricopeptide repeat protein n=1 Tax=Marinobacterium mangrovicola TaxID=1476959 RepID=A0A4R1GGS7_9GAMM|nr:hypothetical protein [Marinobacterium mangrovicola]TCK07268.1 hypothetical protein CLV83_2130 [Marinobacterium mangrovicola]
MSRVKSAIFTAVLASAFSVSVLAGRCPMDAKAVEEGLASAEISDEARSKIMQLHDEGLAAHNAGNHAEAEEKLGEALRMLSNPSDM